MQPSRLDITSRLSQAASHVLPGWFLRTLVLAVLVGLAVGLVIGTRLILATPVASS